MAAINPVLTNEIVNLITEIDEFKGQWKALKTLSPETLRQLRRIATIESVGSSTRIEGAKLSDKEVAALLSGLRQESFRNRDEEEVAGYAAVMDVVFESWDSIPISENYIRQLHGMLLQYSSKDERHRGDYKKTANNVDETGKQVGIVFETASPFDTPFEMEKLVKWLNEAKEEKVLHPLLIAGVFIVWFLAIHPFQDGNGRLSRVLTTLMLLRFGYSYVPYSSLESIVEDNKNGYYTALRKTQQSLKNDSPDWEPWVVFFLRCLVRQKEKLERKIEAEAKQLPELSGLAVEIVNLLAEVSSVTISTIVESTGANRNTVKSTLSSLVERRVIFQKGKGRGVYYTLIS